MGSDWQVLKGRSSIVGRLDHLSCSRYTSWRRGVSRVEVDDRLLLVFASWLGMAAALNWISRVESASRVVAVNRLGAVCAFWLATAAVACWIRRLMREISCGCNSG